MRQRLRVRLVLLFGLAALLVFGLTTLATNFLVVERFSSFAKENREQRYKEFVHWLSSLIASGHELRNHRDFRMAMRRHGILGLKIYSIEGQLLIQIDDMNSPHHARPLRGEPPKPIWHGELVVEDRVLGRVELVAAKDPPHFSLIEDVFKKDVLQTLMIATGLALLVFGGLAWSFARTIARPLEAASEAAARIAGGDLSVRVKPSGVREIAALAEDFNGMADALAQKEALRTRMTSDIAHELRTPVSILKSHLEAVRDGVLPLDESELSSLIDETARLEGIINDLRAIWALESADRDSSQIEEIQLKSALQSLAERFSALAETKKILIEVQDSPDLTIFLDPMVFERTFSNLLANAVKYGKPGGRVELGWRVRDNMVEIWVSDDGPGIPADALKKVFERFYRLDGARDRRGGGAGLGLAIAAEAVESVKGRIWVENNPEAGCRFFVDLPRVRRG